MVSKLFIKHRYNKYVKAFATRQYIYYYYYYYYLAFVSIKLNY